MAAVSVAMLKPQAKQVEKPPVPVKIASVELNAATGSGERYSATIIPRTEVELAFKVGGYVVALQQVRGVDGKMRDLQEGDRISTGDSLAPTAKAYTITVTDSAAPAAQTASKSFSGNIAPSSPALTLNCSTTSGPAVVGAAYSATCTVTGGTPPYNWSITDGALPGGLTLSATTGSSVTRPSRQSLSGTRTQLVPLQVKLVWQSAGAAQLVLQPLAPQPKPLGQAPPPVLVPLPSQLSASRLMRRRLHIRCRSTCKARSIGACR
jgi:hypothetical protein